MKILSISNVHNPFINSVKASKTSNIPAFNNYYGADVVSFSAKKYDSNSIVNPTSHCAYCGCKVYSESQIDSIAKEMLSAKADRLEGKIKSVLEKLSGAKQSQELAVAKRLENEEEIAFFEKFLDVSSKKSYLKGEVIFEQVYDLDKDDALELLKGKMHPLQSTIDHVSPQREEKDNNNSDINLVEACYCCNHDLKKGVSFNEFYAMFPTIKNNMPSEKFKFAISQILDSSQTEVLKRLSATNMLKLLERLFIQRTEASNHLDSIDYRIEGCKSGITHSIETCEAQIVEKQKEMAELKAKMSELSQDEEYQKLEKRLQLVASLDTENTVLKTLRGSKERTSASINELRNGKKNKKTTKPIPEDEKNRRIQALKENLECLTAQIEAQEEKVLGLEIAIEELDKEFPTLEKLQHLKTKVDNIIAAHEFLPSEYKNLSQLQAKLSNVEASIKSTSDEIIIMPDSTKSFNLDDYSEEEKANFSRHKELTEALAYIEDHPNAGALKNLIHQAAKLPLVAEMDKLSKCKSVIDYFEKQRRKELESKLAKLEKEKLDLSSKIEDSQKAITRNEVLVSDMSLEQALNRQKELVETIRRINEKTIQLKIPQQILVLDAEITLLSQTIDDLNKKMQKINEEYPTAN